MRNETTAKSDGTLPTLDDRSSDTKPSTMATSKVEMRFVVYALGIFVCYSYFGYLQEKITRTPYGVSGEIYKCTVALVFIQCVVNCLFAKILLSTFMKQGHDSTHISYYVSSSLTYLLAMVTSNTALQYVNYPTQVVGKSCKPIPVMILGVLIGRKKYSFWKYLFTFMIVIGVGIFMFKNKSSSTSSSSVIGFGEFLLLFSLSMDGLTGAVQERMKTEYKTKSGHMMLNMNLWSTLFLGLTLLVTNEIWEFFDFIQRFPVIVNDIFAFSCLSALGQMFIFLMVSEYGPLPCSIVTTTRKFFTVLFSVFFFGNHLSMTQWSGAFLVFSGLTLDMFYGK